MNLKTDQRRYKVFIEDSYAAEKEDGKSTELWRYYELRGRYGRVYPFSESEMAMSLTAMKIAVPLHKGKRWRCIQNGDDEMVFVLPNHEWLEAAQMVRANKRPLLTPEQIEHKKQQILEARRRLGSRKEADGLIAGDSQAIGNTEIA